MKTNPNKPKRARSYKPATPKQITQRALAWDLFQVGSMLGWLSSMSYDSHSTPVHVTIKDCRARLIRLQALLKIDIRTIKE